MQTREEIGTRGLLEKALELLAKVQCAQFPSHGAGSFFMIPSSALMLYFHASPTILSPSHSIRRFLYVFIAPGRL